METEFQLARAHAEGILLANGGELGLFGLHQAYRQVWARNSMICGLGLWLTKDMEGPAIHAAQTSDELKPAMTDSIILATARAHNATLWTQDEHFENIKGVRYKERKSRK